jgi:hypothetical protein
VKDRVKTPDGDGEVVARSETINGWYIWVTVAGDTSLWKGFASVVELVEAAGEVQVIGDLENSESKGRTLDRMAPGPSSVNEELKELAEEIESSTEEGGR